jgi:hypothetical protein
VVAATSGCRRLGAAGDQQVGDETAGAPLSVGGGWGWRGRAVWRRYDDNDAREEEQHGEEEDGSCVRTTHTSTEPVV